MSRRSLNLPYSPFAVIPSSLATFVLAGIFVFPAVVWYSSANLYSYFTDGAPVGQLWYVFSKLFGLYAVLLIWYQAVSTLLRSTRFSDWLPKWRLIHHRWIGMATAMCVLSHVMCFFIAVTLRKATPAMGLFTPRFDDFYHTSITVGWFAAMIMIIGLMAAAFRRHLPALWLHVHRFMIAVVGLGLLHSVLIGSETRFTFYQFFYGFLVLSFSTALLLRFMTKLKQGTVDVSRN